MSVETNPDSGWGKKIMDAFNCLTEKADRDKLFSEVLETSPKAQKGPFHKHLDNLERDQYLEELNGTVYAGKNYRPV
jgi:hypothetical protein